MMDKGDYVEKEKELKRQRKFSRNGMAAIPRGPDCLSDISHLSAKGVNH